MNHFKVKGWGKIRKSAGVGTLIRDRLVFKARIVSVWRFLKN